MSSLARNWKWLLAILIIAAFIHGATVLFQPRLVMLRTMARSSHTVGVNHMEHSARPTAETRGVVRPSPDLLYSSCVYDLDAAGGAVRVRTSNMPPTYWSISAYDADTNNFFVFNDRQAKDGAADFLLVSPGVRVNAGHLPVAMAPTNRGIVLLRTLINDESRLSDIDAARRNATCEPYGGAAR